jgi:hypothetical protein
LFTFLASLLADALSFTSALSVTLALLAVGTTVYLAGVKVYMGQAEMPRWLPEGTGLFTFFSILPVVANAYICHYNGKILLIRASASTVLLPVAFDW